MMKRREILGLASLVAAPLLARASDYPRAPINLVTPLAAGDAADRAARLMAQELSRLLDTPVTVVNRPGAGGWLGTQSVIHAPKDGYTLLYAQNSPLTIRRVLEPAAANYDPLKDLTPLALTSRSPSVLVVHKDAPFKTLKEMIAHASKAPNSLRVGNAGPGSVGDVSVQLINSATGATLSSVNYKGAAPAITDLLGVHIEGVNKSPAMRASPGQLLPAGIIQEWGSGRALSEEISSEFRSVSELLGPKARNPR